MSAPTRPATRPLRWAIASYLAGDEERRVAACCRSQVAALERSWDGGVADAFAPEQYRRITAPASPSETMARSAGRSTGGDGA